MSLTYLASPLRAPTPVGFERNLAFARMAMAHALQDGETAIAPHLLFTQVLDARNEDQDQLGILHATSLMQSCAHMRLYLPTPGNLTPGMLGEFKAWMAMTRRPAPKCYVLHPSLQAIYRHPNCRIRVGWESGGFTSILGPTWKPSELTSRPIQGAFVRAQWAESGADVSLLVPNADD